MNDSDKKCISLQSLRYQLLIWSFLVKFIDKNFASFIAYNLKEIVMKVKKSAEKAHKL